MLFFLAYFFSLVLQSKNQVTSRIIPQSLFSGNNRDILCPDVENSVQMGHWLLLANENLIYYPNWKDFPIL